VVGFYGSLRADTLNENPQQFPGEGRPLWLAIKQSEEAAPFVVMEKWAHRGLPPQRFFKGKENQNYRGPQSLRIESDILKNITPKLEQIRDTRSPWLLVMPPGRELLIMEKVPGKSLKGSGFRI